MNSRFESSRSLVEREATTDNTISVDIADVGHTVNEVNHDRSDNGGAQWTPPLIDQSELRSALDGVSQELLEARDALIGAESEAGVLRAKLTELEAQLSARNNELDDLSARLQTMEGQPNQSSRAIKQAEVLLRPVASQVKAVVAKRMNR